MIARAEAATIAGRYALAAACISVAVLLRVSPAGSFLYPTEPFILGVLVAAWFGGVGPGVFAALLSAVTVPQLIALTQLPSAEYRLLWGFFDLPRFITLGVTGAAVGCGTSSLRRAQAALRERERQMGNAREELETAVAERTAHLKASEERYARAMEATAAGHWEWDLVTHQVFHSPRFRELYGIPVDEKFADRDAWKTRQPISASDHARQEQALQAAIADPAKNYDIELSFEVRPGEVRWLRSRGKVFRDEHGRPLRISGATTDITAQKLAEEALRRSEERYALAMEASEEGHFDWNVHTDEVFASVHMKKLLDLPGDTECRTRNAMMARVRYYPGDLERLQEMTRQVLAGSALQHEFEYRILRGDELRWLRASWKIFRDAASAALRVIGVLTDITERKHAEALLSGEKRILERVAKGEPLRRVLDDLCRLVEELAPGVLASILLLEGNRLRHGGAPSLPKAYTDMIDGAVIGPSAGSCGTAAYRGQQVIVSDIATDALWADYRALALPHGLRACWSTPVFSHEGKAIATFAMYYREPRSPSPQDQQIIEQIGHLAGVAIQHKLAAEELRDSEARFRSLTELSSDWYWRQDENLRFTYLSTEVDELSGHSAESSLGKTRRELDGISPLSTSWEAHEAVLASRQPFRDFEYSRVGPDGRTRHISVSGAPIFDDQGAFKGYQGIGRNITERKAIDEELRHRQEMLEVAQKAARAVPWQWTNGADPELNKWPPELCAMFGLPAGGFDGTAAAWWRLCHPDDLPRVKASIEQTLATGEIDVEYRVVHPDGKVHWLNQKGRTLFAANGKPVRSIGFMFDVTERRKVEDDLRSRQEMLDLAQKSARAIAFEWKIGATGEGENRWSPDLEAMYGFAPGTYDGSFETWKKLVHPEDWPAVKEAIRHAQRTGEVASEYRVVHPDGSVHWLQAKGRMFFDAAGTPTRMVGFMQDVTQRKHAEDEMRKLEAQLRQAQRLEAMGTMAGGIAHDFNNILGAIIGYGEMALRGAKKDTRLRRDLDAIMSAGERGRALVDRILAFSRSGVGERMPVHVEEVVREALDQLAAKLPENVTIAPRLHAARAAMLGDSTQVHQVVMNLANNAVQAMPHAGVLRVGLETVRLDASRSATVGSVAPGEYIVLRVSDSGTGISPEVFERMFDPFFTTKEVGVGSGLGLSLVHGIVVNVGGAIDVATELGKGSTFTVYLPRRGDAPAKTVDENRPLPRGEGERVLVVDDEEPLVRLATETLERLGYEPVAFTSSAAALAAFRAEPQRFDAVLTDERMPGMSGTTLIREVRGIRNGIPVVLMSGYLGAAPRDARETGVADALGIVPRVPVGIGADVVVKKPLSARDLAASMARALHP